MKALIRSTLTLCAMLMALSSMPQESKPKYDVFSFTQQLTLPGSPTEIYDAVTGDISGWWDHSFSDKPYKLYIEAKPGGGFYEIFNESGDGVKHATVTFADRGKRLLSKRYGTISCSSGLLLMSRLRKIDIFKDFNNL